MVTSIAVVFICMIVGEDNCCVNVLRSIGRNILVENLTFVDLAVRTLFVYNDKRYNVERIDEDNVTTSNIEDVVVCIKNH